MHEVKDIVLNPASWTAEEVARIRELWSQTGAGKDSFYIHIGTSCLAVQEWRFYAAPEITEVSEGQYRVQLNAGPVDFGP